MKIIVVSDSHYERGPVMSLIEMISSRSDIDALIHLGDGSGDVKLIRERLNIPVYSVPGNCDFCLTQDAEQVITLGGVSMLLCHGHTRRVKYSLDSLCYRAQELNVQLALFGHTHRPCLRNEYGVLLLNPGSLAQEVYAEIEIENGQLLTPQLKKL